MDPETNLLKARLEALRNAMHKELEAAGGDMRAPAVLAIAEEFDRLFAEYMRRELRRYIAKRAPGKEPGASS